MIIGSFTNDYQRQYHLFDFVNLTMNKPIMQHKKTRLLLYTFSFYQQTFASFHRF